MNDTVLVSGGAGGIGRAVVSGLLERGLEVIVLDLKQPEKTILPLVTYLELDVCDPTAVRDTFDTLRATRLTSLVTLHGGALLNEFGPLEELGYSEILASINLNLCAHLNLIIHALPLFNASTAKNKSITLVSSINAICGFGLPGYSAAKAGLRGAVVSMMKDLGTKDIRINCVLPGTVPTPRTIQEEPKNFRALEEGSALKRLTTPEEVSKAIIAVALDFRSMTGQELVIDSGQSVMK